ncbi:hypothetical protein BDR26DRAFT_855633 [Obelidium mucronatum]|nr:hypothetical protein BDR26DRAFT_855633 [Obelidium mucronatum]
MHQQLGARIAAAVAETRLASPVAVPFAPMLTRTGAAANAHVALLLALKHANIETVLLLAKPGAQLKRETEDQKDLAAILESLAGSCHWLEANTSPSPDWIPDVQSHPLLHELGKYCKSNAIHTLAFPSTLSNLYNLLVRFPKLGTPLRDPTLTTNDAPTSPFLDELNGYLIPNVFKPIQSSGLGPLLRNAKLRNAGIWGSRDASAFSVDVARPLLPFTNAELRDFCIENGYTLNRNDTVTDFVPLISTKHEPSIPEIPPNRDNTEEQNSNTTTESPTESPIEPIKKRHVQPDRTFASRHDLAVDLLDTLIRRKSCSDVIDLESEFLKPSVADSELMDVGTVIKRVVDAYESLDQQAEKILLETSIRDPPTGTAFLNIPLPFPHPAIPKPITANTHTSLLPKTHWLYNTPLAHNVLRSLTQWTSGSLSAGSQAKMEGFRTGMINFYEAAGRLRLSDGDLRRLSHGGPGGNGTFSKDFGAKQKALHTLINRQNPRLGNDAVQIECPVIGGLKDQLRGSQVLSGRGEGGGDDGGGGYNAPGRRQEMRNCPWVFSRAPFLAGQSKTKKVIMKVGEVKMWDNRFYVSISLPKANSDTGEGDNEQVGGLLAGLDVNLLRFCVRPFTVSDYHGLLDRMHHGIGDFGSSFAEIELVKQRLGHFMQTMPTQARQTVPCVALVQDNGDDLYVLAVPSVGVLTEKGVVDIRLSFWGEAWRGIRAARKEVSFAPF